MKIETLKRVFGYDSFRSGQETLVDALAGGRDALGIMPTGGGKSLCYQLPALLRSGTAIVISPLISLMADQVAALEDAGVRAAFINSSLGAAELSAVYRNARAGAYRIIYVAPERLETEGFASLAREIELSLVAVDEAHCVSQWGQDFRPSYLKIAAFIESLPVRPPVGAFTATATQRVRDDIERMLGLREPVRVVTGFDRPNLNFEVLRPRDKFPALKTLVTERRGRSGIVYCATRATVEKVCDELRELGHAATRYHAGISAEERRANQEDFTHDRCPIVVATNAFGMGIDKSNVGFVIHYNMPKSLEAYYQEAGRAGRDGEAADCILLYAAGDVVTAKFLIQNPGENEDLSEEERRNVIRQDLARLDAMIGYCTTTRCLRGYILEYFGQEYAEKCGNCGNCRTVFETVDVTREAQMILSCVRRVQDKLGYSLGSAAIVNVLHGSAAKRVLELGLNELSTYGLMKELPTGKIREIMTRLEDCGYLFTDETHGAVRLTAKAREVLFGGEVVEMETRRVEPVEKVGRKRKSKRAAPEGVPDEVFETLREVRTLLAQKEGVPPYIIFSNATLADMAAKMPKSHLEFLEVSGVGETKARKYGEAFLLALEKLR